MDCLQNKESTDMSISSITLAGGCFWCTEAIFKRIKGVSHVEPGYANGIHANQPTYEEVCTGKTGYAEVVRLNFDSQVISLTQLLEIFFATHDPTTLNRQGEDKGTQYRSAVFYETDEERDTALALIEEIDASKILAAPVVTEVQALQNYWSAEAYHHDYFAKHPEQGYCAAVIGPKVQKLMHTLHDFMKD